MHTIDGKIVQAASRTTPNHFTGFSLIEIAVAILILGLLLAGLMIPFATQSEQRNQARTQATLEEVRHALYGFAMANGRLPMPALSEREGSENNGTCTHKSVCVGFLPRLDLGVEGMDAWGKYLRYGVTRKFAEPKDSFTLADTGVWNIETRLSGNPEALVVQASRIIAVVHSFGARNFGRTQSGELANNAPGTPSPTNIDEIFNAHIVQELAKDGERTPSYRSRSMSTSDARATGGQFDDQLVWIPTSLFMSKMVEVKRLP